MTPDVHRRELTGLRGVACLIVLILHAVALNIKDTQDTLGGLPRIGVWLFFVLSAFLLTLGLLGDFSRVGLLKFARNRVLRIYPALIVALAIYMLLSAAGIASPQHALAVTLLIYGPNHFWTIPTELWFYAALPVAIGCMRVAERYTGRWGALAALGLVVAVFSAAFPPHVAPEGPLTPIWFSAVFCAGVAAAYAKARFDLTLPSWAGYAALAGIVAFAGMGKALGWNLVDKHYVFGPLMAVVVLATYKAQRPWAAWWPLVQVGKAAFSTYLIHWLVIESLTFLPWPVAIPVSIAISLALGGLGYVAIERPVYARRDRLPPIPSAHSYAR